MTVVADAGTLYTLPLAVLPGESHSCLGWDFDGSVPRVEMPPKIGQVVLPPEVVIECKVGEESSQVGRERRIVVSSMVGVS